MPQGNPKPGEKYLHFKNKLYQIITVAVHSETNEEMVVYQALYGTFKSYVRPLSMFISEVDHEKYPEVMQEYRFQYIEIEEDSLPVQAAKENDVDSSGKNQGEIKEEACPINNWLIRFLDAESFDEKYEIVTEMKSDINDKLIDDLAVSLDVVIPEGNLQNRYQQLKNCIRTRQKFEGGRIS
ncbi:Uncharacterized protein conserved in bacteria [uncultured Roseburia sp.]|uniref:DUF1653 domain-containing protein n=1 Tax=Brotonthovivens ammoniilytica TaxID=2981725 RepID=A0ABT2TL03_9FIRM|nr:DUF1653 domain-containing protein [Brotonthovivens ammoniilytica]MCU6762376.1 DUF1653 domain-containing protein [Brotonthovivens ammoniilytica]SCI69768.1 Uncharacterized protein conserved in bacteria [uncultured Roseburia sp.]